ncbi:hypothetical protein L6164_016227 [Bauhinia variegata]|uniref:Uncharacterized protein n=1 Tax=Bauhinia variegata TaxID=167791 RepID=A0ACB9NMV6_BAUVA|nr:hypothetical protein L6164_016227 [Bauhinia variegata]
MKRENHKTEENGEMLVKDHETFKKIWQRKHPYFHYYFHLWCTSMQETGEEVRKGPEFLHLHSKTYTIHNMDHNLNMYCSHPCLGRFGFSSSIFSISIALLR